MAMVLIVSLLCYNNATFEFGKDELRTVDMFVL